MKGCFIFLKRCFVRMKRRFNFTKARFILMIRHGNNFVLRVVFTKKHRFFMNKGLEKM
ncbi:MAG: hypothetical protein LBL74_05560 [Bacteroidales bacterium]|nr:hypothetical protein [Bacteroidales bacterium]